MILHHALLPQEPQNCSSAPVIRQNTQQCSEVFPKLTPNDKSAPANLRMSLSAAQPEGDQLSSNDAFTWAQVTPKLLHKAQGRPSAPVIRQNTQRSEFLPSEATNNPRNAPLKCNPLSVPHGVNQLVTAPKSSKCLPTVLPHVNQKWSIATANLKYVLWDKTPNNLRALDTSRLHDTSAHHMNTPNQKISRKDQTSNAQNKEDAEQATKVPNPQTPRTDVLHIKANREATSTAVHCQGPSCKKVFRQREGCGKKKPPSTKRWLQPSGQEQKAYPWNQTANQGKKTWTFTMASTIHDPELDPNEKLLPDILPPATKVNAQNLEPTPKKPPQGHWTIGHQVILQLNPGGKNKTIQVKSDKQVTQSISDPTISSKQRDKVCRMINHLRSILRTQYPEPDPGTQFVEPDLQERHLRDLRPSETTLSARQELPHSEVNLGGPMNQAFIRSSSPSIFLRNVWKHRISENQPFIAPNSPGQNSTMRSADPAAAEVFPTQFTLKKHQGTLKQGERYKARPLIKSQL